MKRLKAYIRRLGVKGIILLQKIKLPGFQGMGLYDVMKFFVNALMDSKFTLMAAAMAYQFFFSFFPTLILVFIVLPQFPIERLEGRVVEFLRQFFPEDGFTFLDVEQIAENYLAGEADIWLVVVSILLALWGSTRGIIAMMKAFTKNEDVFKKRNILELYGTALMIFFILGSIIIFSVSLEAFMDFIQLEDYVGIFIVKAIKILITLATIFMTISTLYFLAPATQQRWKFISPGAVTAGVLTMGAIIGLNYYFANFTNFNKLYGSLGAIILLMVWFYYISIVLLIGFELNAAIDLASYHYEKSHPKPEDNESAFQWIAEGHVSDAAEPEKSGGWHWHRRS